MNERAVTARQLPAQAVRHFERDLRGTLLRPGDAGYDEARRVWNGMIDRHPALIVRCAGSGDVVRALAFAREHDLTVAVRGGGHSFPGHSVCDGGIVIDLTQQKEIAIDPARRVARVEPGVLWGEFDRQAHASGLAVTGGQISHTGVAGLTLGGGLGWLMRKHGLSCDNLSSVELITADGTLLTASADEHPDLFWGLRGGGGNFGVATAFTFRLHPLDTVYGGLIAFPLPEAATVLAGYREQLQGCPDELTTTAALLTTPDGHPALGIGFCYAGDAAAGERLVTPFKRLGTVVMDRVGPMPYPAVQAMLDDVAVPQRRYYLRSNLLRDLGDDVIAAVVEGYARVASPLSLIILVQMGGAVARVDPLATAFPHRDAQFSLSAFSCWTDPAADAPNVAWVRELWQTLSPHLPDRVYVNELADEGEERVRAAYGPAFERLAQLKRQYDPDNVFRLNQNIRPAA